MAYAIPDWSHKELLIGDPERPIFSLSDLQKDELLKLLSDCKLEFKNSSISTEFPKFITHIQRSIDNYLVYLKNSKIQPTVKQQEKTRDILAKQLDDLFENLSGNIGSIKVDLLNGLANSVGLNKEIIHNFQYSVKHDENNLIYFGLKNYLSTTKLMAETLKNIDFKYDANSFRGLAKNKLADSIAYIFNESFINDLTCTYKPDTEKHGGYVKLLLWSFSVADGTKPGGIGEIARKAVSKLKNK